MLFMSCILQNVPINRKVCLPFVKCFHVCYDDIHFWIRQTFFIYLFIQSFFTLLCIYIHTTLWTLLNYADVKGLIKYMYCEHLMISLWSERKVSFHYMLNIHANFTVIRTINWLLASHRFHWTVIRIQYHTVTGSLNTMSRISKPKPAVDKCLTLQLILCDLKNLG